MKPGVNPCQYSGEIIEVLRGLIRPGEHVHDPFAGHGRRLGQLCDQLGATFTGTDIEPWPDSDPRVLVGDARDLFTYPVPPFTVVTSPVYANKRCADYANGPTPTTKTKGRRDYGIALGRPLHRDNLARLTGRESKVESYYVEHGQAVKHWWKRVVLNVDSPIAKRWSELLTGHGYTITDIIPAYTRRYGGLDNADKRADHEVIIVAVRHE
jgi:hypothetical protein